MKRIRIHTAAALLAGLLALSSCSGIGLSPSETDAPDTSDTLISDVPPTAVTLSAERLSLLTDNLGYIDSIPFPVMDMSRCADGKLLFSGGDYESSETPLALFSLTDGLISTGTYRREQSADSLYTPMDPYLLNGHPVLLGTETAELVCFDEQFNPTDSCSIDEISFYCSPLLLSDDCLIITCSFNDAMFLVTVSDEGKISYEIVPLPLEEGSYLAGAVSVLDDDHIVLATEQEATGSYVYQIYDRKADALTPLYFDEGSYYFDVWSGTIGTYNYETGEAALYPKEYPSLKKVFRLSEGAMPIGNAAPDTRFFYDAVTDYENDLLTIERRSLETGALISSVMLENAAEGFPYQIDEIDGLVSFALYGPDSYRLYFWKPEETGASSESPYVLLTEMPLQEKVRALRRELEETYGISIKLGDDAVRFLSDYAIVPADSADSQLRTLTALKNFLEALPEGFFAELLGCFDGMELDLTGRIIPDTGNRNSINDATAVTYTLNGEAVVLFDITQWNIEKTVAHEFLHVMENAVMRKNEKTDNKLEAFRRWSLLNPEGFEYANVYTSENGNTLSYDNEAILGSSFDPDKGMSADDIYFVDGYSTTYPGEDHARLFENIFPLADHELPAYFEGAHIREKVSYLCVCLREAFDSITDDVKPCWERAADPEMDLEYFRETYPDSVLWANAKG